MTPSTISDYLVVPITYPATASYPHEATHNLYIRPHTPKVPTKLAPQSLFIANIPPDTTISHLRSILTCKPLLAHAPASTPRPTITSITFPSLPAAKTSTAKSKKRKRQHTENDDENDTPHDPLSSPFPSTFDRALHPAGSAAIIILDSRATMTHLFSTLQLYASSPSAPRILWPSKAADVKSLGSARYKTHLALSRPASSSLSQLVDSYMLNLAKVEAEQARKRTARAAEPDEDGFITVTRGPRPSRNDEAAAEALEAMRAKEAKKKEGMSDFYRFQLREKRKERERELKGKFEGDVARVRRRMEQRRGT